jgi:hypothetical protein
LAPESLMSLSSLDFDFLSFLDFLPIVVSGFLGVGRACLEAGLYSYALKCDCFVGLLWLSERTTTGSARNSRAGLRLRRLIIIIGSLSAKSRRVLTASPPRTWVQC